MRILVPLNGSLECEVSLPIAARLVSALNADVCLLQVLGGFATVKGHVHHEPEWEGGIEGEILAMMKKARNYLDELVARYELPTDRTRCLVGRNENTAKEIITFAENNGIDLIVIASHCGGWVRQLTQGSVCSEVVRSRICPVLCVPLERSKSRGQRRGALAARR